MHVIEYDGKSLLNFKQQKGPVTSQLEVPMPSQEYTNSFNQQFTLPSLPVPSEQNIMDPGFIAEGQFSISRELIEKIHEDRKIAEEALDLPMYSKFKDDPYLKGSTKGCPGNFPNSTYSTSLANC